MTVTIDARAPDGAPEAAGRDLQGSSARSDGPPAPARRTHHLVGADALRALAALGVIVVHTSAWPSQSGGADGAVWYSTTLVARFCVPAFVLLTGLVLAYRYGDQKLGREFLLRRTRRSVVPWLVWAPIFIVFDILVSGQVDPTWSSVRDWWSSGGGHLYFLVLVPQFYVLMLLWPARRRPTVILTLALLAVMVGLDTYRLYAPISGGALHQAVLDHGFLEFPFWIGYFAIGIAAGRMLAARDGRGWPAWPFVAAIPLATAALLWVDTRGMANSPYASGTGAFLRPLLVPLTLCICAAVVFGAPAVLSRMPRLGRATSVLSRHSLGVYIVHPILLTFLGRWTFDTTQAHLPLSIPLFIGLTGATAISALVVAWALSYTPLAVTIGEHWRRPGRDRELVGRRAGGVRAEPPGAGVR